MIYSSFVVLVILLKLWVWLVPKIIVKLTYLKFITFFSLEKQTSSGTSTSTCEVCNSLKLDNCTCKSKNNISSTPSNTHISTSSKENSVETTPLSDLPGKLNYCMMYQFLLLNSQPLMHRIWCILTLVLLRFIHSYGVWTC